MFTFLTIDKTVIGNGAFCVIVICPLKSHPRKPIILLIPVYSGSRVWKFQTKYHYGANWSGDYHEDEDGNKYFPIATMYSIT